MIKSLPILRFFSLSLSHFILISSSSSHHYNLPILPFSQPDLSLLSSTSPLHAVEWKMPANLCCAADQRSGSSSPELPNARLSDSTPARRPLLPSKGNSYGSRFTSARSEDLHEPRQIFESAATIEYSPDSPSRLGRRARTSSSPHNL